MERRTFLQLGGAAFGSMLVPVYGEAIAAEELLAPMAVQAEGTADAASNAATQAGASYCDVRIGRYLQQFIATRDLKVQNVTNTESAGVGARGGPGCLWFCRDPRHEPRCGGCRGPSGRGDRQSQRQVVERAGAAPVKGVGEVSWASSSRGSAQGAHQRQGRHVDRRQQGRHGRRSQLHAVRCCSG